MATLGDVLGQFADQFRLLRDRVEELERLETYYGTLDLNGFTLTLSADTTLSGTPAPNDAKYIVQQSSADLTAEQSLGSLSTGLLKNTTSTGVLSIATASDLPDHASNHASAGSDPISIAASQVTSGSFSAARLGSGTPSASTVLFGDSTWAALVAADIPSLDTSKITSGTMATARLGSGTASASTLLFGDSTWAVLAAADIPAHSAALLTSGTVATARLGSGTASASTLLFGDSTWAALVAADIPSLDGSKITTGTVDSARLGTGTQNTTTFLRGDNVWTNTLGGNFGLPTGNNYFINNLPVVKDRRTGWTAATGVATRGTFATSTVTLATLAEHVKALIDDLITHGLIGA